MSVEFEGAMKKAHYAELQKRSKSTVNAKSAAKSAGKSEDSVMQP